MPLIILKFHDTETERVAAGRRSRKFQLDIQDKAFRLLVQMARVTDWNDLRNPPGNKLNALHGDRAGQYAIWINRRWRIAFTPEDGLLANVQIIDYH